MTFWKIAGICWFLLSQCEPKETFLTLFDASFVTKVIIPWLSAATMIGLGHF
jgi:hypothetical protein